MWQVVKSVREIGSLFSVAVSCEVPNIDEGMVQHSAKFFLLRLIR